MRSVGANIVKLANEADTFQISVNGTAKTIKLINEETGDMLNTYQVLKQISDYWDEMTASERSALTLQLANKTQMETLASVLSNFDTAEKALTTSLEAEGSALEENNKILDTIQGKTKTLRAELEEFVLGDGVLEKIYKLVLDLGIALFKFANSDIGKTIIMITLLYTSLKALKSLLTIKPIAMFIDGIKELGSVFLFASGEADVFTVSTAMLSSAMKVLGIEIKKVTLSLMKNPLFVIAVTIGAVIAGLKKAIDVMEEGREELQKANEEYETAKNNFEEATNKLDDIKERLKEIEEIRASGNVSSEQLQKLNEEEESLQRQLILQTDLTKKAEDEAKAKAESARQAQGHGVVLDFESDTGLDEDFTRDFMNTESIIKMQTQHIEILTQKIEEARIGYESLAKTEEEYNNLSAEEQEEWKAKVDEYNEATAQLDAIQSSYAGNISLVKDWIDAGIDEDGTLQALYDDYVNLHGEIAKAKYSDPQQVFDELGTSADEVRKALEGDEEALDAFNEALNNNDIEKVFNYATVAVAQTTKTLEEATEAYKNAVSAISSMESSFTNLNDVITSYNQNGYLSLEMLDKLLSMDSEYLSLLDWENGQMSLNEESALALADAKISIAEAELIAKAQAEAEAIANGEVNDTWIAGEEASKIASIAAETAGMSAEEAGEKAKESAKKWDEFWSSVAGDMSKYDTKDKKDQLARLEKETKNSLAGMENYRKTLRSTTGGIKSYTSATKGATSATKSQKSAVDELTKSLEAQIKEYERVIKYINKKFDQEIDRIKDLKDAELDSIDARIDALEELRDAQLDAIQDQIDALEKENDALSDQLELQELLNNLAKAKSSKVKIYRGGQFVYDQDFEQVNEAQKALNEYNAKKRLQDQIDALNNYKDQVKKNYDQQIKDLENYRKAREKAWDAQIKYWEDYKQKFNDMVNSYENEQDRLKALELTGIDFEQQGWQTRLGNLTNFVNNYISLLNQLTEAKKKAQAEEYASSASAPSGGGGGGGATSSAKSKHDTSKIHVSTTYQGGRQQTVKWRWNEAGNKVMLHASGSNYIKADELAVVGEDPHKEIVIGSDLNSNNGVMMNLHKGSGVVPATATSALMSLADNIRANGVNATANDIMSGGDVTNMEIANVNVNANNADEFVQSMREFRISMLQKAYK